MRELLFKKTVKVLVLLLVFTIVFIEAGAEETRIFVKSFDIINSAPKMINGVMYVPLRSIYESLGWSVDWNPKFCRVTCTREKDKFEFSAGSKDFYTGGKYSLMDEPMVIAGGKSYLARKFITQQLGMKIRWNKRDNLIIMSDNGAGSVTVNGGSNIVISGDGIIVNIFEPCSEETINDMISYTDRLLNANNPGDALTRYKDIIEDISYEDMPELYARAMNNTGNAYSMLAEIKDPKSNIKNAIDSYNKALVYYKDNDDIAGYSIVLNNLTNAYRILYDITGEKTYLTNAMERCDELLKFFTPDNYCLDYALTQYNRGLVYSRMGLIKSAGECWIKAGANYESILGSNTINEKSPSYPVVNFNLGNIYCALAGISFKKEDFQKSERCYEEALKFWTAEAQPMKYAKVNKCIGDIYLNLYKTGNSIDHLNKARKKYEDSLKFYTVERQPYNYALINYDMGNLSLMAYETEGDINYLKDAKEAYTNSLNVFNMLEYPRYYDIVCTSIKRTE